MNWRTLKNPNDVVGVQILLREEYAASNNITYIAGIVYEDGYDGFYIKDHNGTKTELSDDYRYYYILVKEILF